MICIQDLHIDPSTRRAWNARGDIALTRMEFDLLHALMSRPGDIVDRGELMRTVWGTTFYRSTKTIDVHLGWLRRKIGDNARNPRLITTVRGQGLRFETTAAASQ